MGAGQDTSPACWLRSTKFCPVNLAYLRVGGQLFRGTGLEDVSFKQEVGPVCDVKGFLDVVIGDQDADAFGPQLRDDVLDVLDGDGIDPGKRFIEENETGVRSEGPGDFRPPLLAAAEDIAAVVPDVGQAEFFEQFLEARLARCGSLRCISSTAMMLSSTLSFLNTEGSWGR